MITLTAKINILSSEDSTLSSVTSSIAGNNISSSISNVLNTRKTGGNPFLLGISKLGSGAYFSSGEDYFIGSEIADENGKFNNSYEIVLSGKNITAFEILFDNYNNQYPISITVDGIVYANDDTNFQVSVDSANSHTITIDNWNTPNYPLRIQGIYADISIDIDIKNLISIERSIFDRGDTIKPSWGIISNTGNIEFIDNDGEVEDYIEQQLIHSGIKVDIYINNTNTNSTQKVGVFETDTWDYDNNTRQVSVQLANNLDEWQDILIDGINYIPNQSTPQNFKYFYDYLYNVTPAKYNMQTFNELDDKTQSVLQNTYIVYPLLESSSLWTAWTKLCEACLLHIYVNHNGKTVCATSV